MKQNFAYPLHIQGTKEQLEAMQNQLETLFGYQTAATENASYNEKDYRSLTTNWAASKGLLGYTNNLHKESYGRTVVHLPADRELALALAAMRTEGAFEKGETLVFIERGRQLAPLGSLAKVISDRHTNDGGFVEVQWLDMKYSTSGGLAGGYFPWRFRRATKEELINFYRHGSATLKSDPLPFPAESRKITGYKVPFNLYGGRINAGEVMSKKNPIGHYIMLGVTLPAEIVEQWEPVYEEEVKVQELMIGQNKQVVVYVKPGEYIKSEGAKIGNVDNLTRLYEYMKALPKSGLPWLVDNLRVNIGCLEVTTDDLKKVLYTYGGGKHE